MGLDVYVRWPDMTKEEREAQFTGYRNAGAAGYLRQSWGSLSAWDAICQVVFSKSWSDLIFPEWDGCNDGEGPDLSKPEEREKLLANRAILQEYIDNPTAVPEPVYQYFSDECASRENVLVEEFQHMVAFIDLALSKDGATIKFS